MRLLRTVPLLFYWISHAGNSTLAAAADQPTAPGLQTGRLHVIASELLFGTVNSTDAMASMRIWTEQICGIRGIRLEPKVEVVHSLGQIRQSLKDQNVDLLVLDTPDYLPLADAKLIEVVAAGTSRGKLSAFPYLLLTKDALEGGQIDKLRGKRIVIASRTKSNLGLVWLETLLAEKRLGRAAGFFESLEIGYRASACILPLFFGKIDACIVDSLDWESFQELNPQLSRLRVAARSEALLEGLIAMPIQPHPLRTELIESILNLHKTPAGEQLGLVFKTGPLMRAGREQFETVRVLCGKYQTLLDATGNGSVHSAGWLGETAGKERR